MKASIYGQIWLGIALAGLGLKRNRPRPPGVAEAGRHDDAVSILRRLLDVDETQREGVVRRLHQVYILAHRPDQRLLVQRDVRIVLGVDLGGRRIIKKKKK